VSLLFIFCTFGVTLSSGLKLCEDSGRFWLLSPAALFAAWLSAIACSYVSGRTAPVNFNHALGKIPLIDIAAFNLWVTLFYGSFYAVSYFASRRRQRLSRSLAALRAAREEAEAALREARVLAVQGQMQPAMLLDALSALQRSYASSRTEGDRMFDILVAFLRAAMPGLRSGSSTLGAELEVVDRYASLRKALKVEAPAWRLQLLDPPPDVPFPPLRLLPALDRISRCAPADASIVVTTEQGAEAFVLRIDVPVARALPLALRQHLRSAARRDLGSAVAAVDWRGSLIAELHFTPPVCDPHSLH
jgi:hypothetical protein